ncbi:uncharacterized protein Tco_0780040 [Tanacetum coccineum]
MLDPQLLEIIKHKYNIDGNSVHFSYHKDWKCKEKAIKLARGMSEDSYKKLPSYLHMLKLRVPSSITDVTTHEGRFRYCFMSLATSIGGFSYLCPLLYVDGAFLKTKYNGFMLSVVAVDTGNQLLIVAHAIVGIKIFHVYCYFLKKLKEAIGEPEDLVFISDRHNNISNSLAEFF